VDGSMSSIDTSGQICYFACHRRSLDDKRRVQVPSKWYKKNADGSILTTQYALILWPHDDLPDQFIQVLPPEKFKVLWDKVTAVRFGDPDGQALKRTLAEKMEQLELDGAGRLTLPDWMATAAGLAVGKEVVLNGMFDCFQIWSPDRYETTRPSVAAKVPNAFKDL
jgi:division/cell wall cluster transcriptional repressor MraZ